jgi:hypothetical protein
MVTGKRFVFVASLALALSVPTLAQRRNGQQQEAPASANSPQIGPMAQSKPELDAFVALQNEQNPANAVTLGDKFLATYPNSQLNGYVQRFRMVALMRTGKCQDAITRQNRSWSRDHLFGTAAELQTRSEQDRQKFPQVQKFIAQTDGAKLRYYQTIASCIR